jgi:dGTP triphosphohydrolase
MEKRVSAPSVYALKEALCTIFWYKNDLRGFLRASISDPAVLNRADWTSYKRQIVSDIIDALVANQRKYQKDLEKLFEDVANMNSFRHLEQLEDGAKKVSAAKAAVADVKRVWASHEKVNDEERAIEDRRLKEAQRLAQSAAVQEKLKGLQQRYLNLVIAKISPQARGYELEKLIYDLFSLFDLDPKASFKNTGEQIDGAFNLEGDYLFEGKWQNELVAVQELDGFAAKVKRKLDNTLGLFFSMNGFSPDGVAAHSKERQSFC